MEGRDCGKDREGARSQDLRAPRLWKDERYVLKFKTDRSSTMRTSVVVLTRSPLPPDPNKLMRQNVGTSDLIKTDAIAVSADD